MSMTMEILEGEIQTMLHGFMLQSKKSVLVSGVSVQFLVEDFGIIISGINRADYKVILDAVDVKFKDWRKVFITTFDDIEEIRYEVLWELMRSGYMTWLRMEHPRPFTRLITEGFGDRIINRRLELWSNKPKYNYLISLNEWAKQMAKTYVLSIYPGFFDTMVGD